MSDNHDYPCSRQWRGYYNNDNSDYFLKEDLTTVTGVWLGQVIFQQKTGVYEVRVDVACEDSRLDYDKEQALTEALRQLNVIYIFNGYRIIDAVPFRKRGDDKWRFYIRYKVELIK